MRRAPAPHGVSVRFERGIAAVELAIIVSATFFILPAVLLFGRLLYQYNVIEEAARDAARYMASIPLADMQVAASAQIHADLAAQMIKTTVAAAGVAPATGLLVDVLCDDSETCGNGTPATIIVKARYTLDDSIFFYKMTSRWTGDDGRLTFRARSIVPYVN
jgi:predicted TIM-barrel enzyme